jgi:hypothetical protein
MSANNSSAVNALGNNTNVATTTSPLLRLPNELIEAVAEKLNKPADLISMRSTCHHLRNGSAMTFSKLCFNDTRTEISGTGSSIRHMTDMLLSPNLLGAQHLARYIKTSAPRVYPNSHLDIGHLRESLSPSPEDIARLFAAMPNLDEVFLSDWNDRDPHLYYKPKVGAVQSAPILLRSLATPAPCLPHLRRMSLFHVRVDAALLASVIEQHKHSLEWVWLSSVRTTGTASWIEVLKRLLATDLSSFRLSHLESVDDSGNFRHVVFPLKPQLTVEGAPFYDLVSSSQVRVGKKHVKPVLEILIQAFESSEWLEEGGWF